MPGPKALEQHSRPRPEWARQHLHPDSDLLSLENGTKGDTLYNPIWEKKMVLWVFNMYRSV